MHAGIMHAIAPCILGKRKTAGDRWRPLAGATTSDRKRRKKEQRRATRRMLVESNHKKRSKKKRGRLAGHKIQAKFQLNCIVVMKGH